MMLSWGYRAQPMRAVIGQNSGPSSNGFVKSPRILWAINNQVIAWETQHFQGALVDLANFAGIVHHDQPFIHDPQDVRNRMFGIEIYQLIFLEGKPDAANRDQDRDDAHRRSIHVRQDDIGQRSEDQGQDLTGDHDSGLMLFTGVSSFAHPDCEQDQASQDIRDIIDIKKQLQEQTLIRRIEKCPAKMGEGHGTDRDWIGPEIKINRDCSWQMEQGDAPDLAQPAAVARQNNEEVQQQAIDAAPGQS